MVIVLLIWFRRRFNQQGKVARGMSSSTYAVYFIHAPILVATGLLFRDVSLHPLIKFALIGPLSVGLCFLIGYYLRKLPLVRRVL
jgi:surface polysaccharide O-acyltransferase-like enzyme